MTTCAPTHQQPADHAPPRQRARRSPERRSPATPTHARVPAVEQRRHRGEEQAVVRLDGGARGERLAAFAAVLLVVRVEGLVGIALLLLLRMATSSTVARVSLSPA